MERNRKILKIGLIVITALVVISYVGVYLLFLDEPIVMEHYIEEQVYFGHLDGPRPVHLELNYITNATDHRVVIRVDFPEYPDLEVYASEFGMHGGFPMFINGQQQTPGSIKARYNLRTVYLEFHFDDDDLDAESVAITEALIQFSDGSVVENEIGSINFHFAEERSEVVESKSISGFDHRTVTEFTVNEDVELIGIESEFLPLIQENLELKVNNRDIGEIEGMKIGARKIISVVSNIRSPEVQDKNLRTLKLRPKLRFLRENGEEETTALTVGGHRGQEYDFLEILQYLHQRGDL